MRKRKMLPRLPARADAAGKREKPENTPHRTRFRAKYQDSRRNGWKYVNYTRERERERAAGQVKERAASTASTARLKTPDTAYRQVPQEEIDCCIVILMNVFIFL